MITNDVLINSEQSLLGAIIKNNDCFDDVDLQPKDFFVKSHELIFNEMALMIGEGKQVDLITLAESLQTKEQLKQVGELKYISQLVQSCSTTKNIKSHAKLVKKSSLLRSIKSLSQDINKAADQNKEVEEINEIAEKGLFDLLGGADSGGLVHIREAVAEAIDYTETHGLNTGLRDLDRLIHGFKKSNLIIIGGRPSMGKSTLAMQIAEHAAKKHSVVIFSLEMAKREVANRFYMYHKSLVSDSEAFFYLAGLRLHIDDRSSVTAAYIRSACRKIKRLHGLDMIVIDYIQLMRGTGDNRNQEIGSISRALKGIAKEFDIPVVVLSQLGRDVEKRGDKRPIMSDLRESGEIEQDADIILFIYREEVYNKETENKGIAEIICRKNRNGMIGSVYTTFNAKLTRFHDFDGEIVSEDIKKETRGFNYV